MTDWTNARVMVTGGEGFLGTHLVAALRAAGCKPFVVSHSDYNLTSAVDVAKAFEEAGRQWCGMHYRPGCECPPHLVFHLAALCGGIGMNRRRPADLFVTNALMGIHMITYAQRQGVRRFVQVGTVCSYPRDITMPFREADIWHGYPEPTNASYAMAKKMLLVHLQAAREQHGFDGIYVIPTNLYGPWDNFDPEDSHVIPAMIRRFIEARACRLDRVTLWGTGRPTRDFLYAADCAAGLMAAAERWEGPEPVNLGSGREVQIAMLASMIANHVDYPGQINFDRTKPDGQPRRVIDSTKARELLGWEPRISLIDGLKETIAWYQATRPRIDAGGPPSDKTGAGLHDEPEKRFNDFGELDELIRRGKGPSV